MDFSLDTFAESFSFSKDYSSYTSFAFILGTTADKEIFPNLISYFSELHELTSDLMLIIAPQVIMYKAPNVMMNNKEITKVLRTGKFYNHYDGAIVDVKDQVQRFLENQTSQSIEFCKFCGIPYDQMPCVVFFSNLTDPKEYIVWNLSNQDASTVIKDFRAIISKIESEYKDFLENRAQIKKLEHKLCYIDSHTDWIEENKADLQILNEEKKMFLLGSKNGWQNLIMR